jgi:hypothetical protein
MTASRFTDHTGSGTAAARPAASTVPQGFIYFATDTLVISKSDGVSTWSDQLSPTEAKLAFSDVTTNNATSTKHGYTPKTPADATQFLNGAGTAAFAAVKDSDLSTSDIATNNASTSKHGFLLKLDNNAAHYMDGTGAWSTPAGGGGGGVTELNYTEATSPVTVTGTSEGSPTTVITASGAVAVSGSEQIKIEFFSNGWACGASDFMIANLWRDSTALGRLGATSISSNLPVYFVRYLTPSAGSYTFSVRAWRGSVSGGFGAGAGASTQQMPMYIRITKGG